MRILYVENHATFARQVCNAFLSEHHVMVVPTLAEARLELANTNWDVVLIDYDLDDGKGIELVREFGTKDPCPLVIAASAFDHRNHEMKQAGADAICGKLQFSQICKTLRRLAHGTD